MNIRKNHKPQSNSFFFNDCIGWLAKLGIALLLCGGCTATGDTSRGDDVVFLVPGVTGATARYQNVIDGLRSGGVRAQVQVINWGAPAIMFFSNFSDPEIHADAEFDLAKKMRNWRLLHPTGRIDIIAHSAGCGVALGAFRNKRVDARADTVVLLAPSVSPDYDLTVPLEHANLIHAFISDRDTVFLKWRTGNFGGYDGVRSAAAGNKGFDLSKLDMTKRKRFIQHPYDPVWGALGNDGGHFGSLSVKFSQAILAPLLKP